MTHSGDMIDARAYSVDELRAAVFENRGGLSRPLALGLLARKNYAKKVADLQQILLDEKEQPRLRSIAASGLSRLGTRAGPKRVFMTSDGKGTVFDMGKRPTRIELLELDIDLRLSDLWSEACGVSEWNLEVVSAFLRAAYGKGYCDALTEEAPGSLCVDHGYRTPDRRATESAERAA